MKLYATVTSERNSRSAKKGGNERITIDLMYKNKTVHVLDFEFGHSLDEVKRENEIYRLFLDGEQLI